MDDDLDELLDEVESKFCGSVSVTPQASSDLCTAWNHNKQAKVKATLQSSTTPASEGDSEDIDTLLQDILLDDSDSSNLKLTEQLSKGTETEKRCVLQSGERKCCPVFLGGSSTSNGLGTAVSQRSCDQLRCTSCDFRVAMFDDHEWDPSCDYLFFRNNMPDCQKLHAKLRRRKGGRAYACQCSWHSARCLAHLSSLPQLKWVCGKHRA